MALRKFYFLYFLLFILVTKQFLRKKVMYEINSQNCDPLSMCCKIKHTFCISIHPNTYIIHMMIPKWTFSTNHKTIFKLSYIYIYINHCNKIVIQNRHLRVQLNKILLVHFEMFTLYNLI